jgi:phage terminase large subunit-like protein
LTPGSVVDQAEVRRQINADDKLFDIQSIGFDEWNAVKIVTELKDEDGFDMYLMRQGMKTLNKPTKDFEDLVIGGKLRHGGNALLRYQAQSVVVRFDDNMTYMPAKRKSRTHIDGIVAAIMAKGRADADDGSIYEKQGLRTI